VSDNSRAAGAAAVTVVLWASAFVAIRSAGGHFSPGKGGPNVELWDRETGQQRLALRGTKRHIWSLTYSPDGTKRAVGGTNP